MDVEFWVNGDVVFECFLQGEFGWLVQERLFQLFEKIEYSGESGQFYDDVLQLLFVVEFQLFFGCFYFIGYFVGYVVGVFQ